MRKPFSYIAGATLVFLGWLFLLDNLGYLDAEWIIGKFWPLLLIVAGVWILGTHARWKHRSNERTSGKSGSTVDGGEPTEDHISSSGVLGNVRREITSKQFSGGDCSTVLGNLTVDLSRAELAPGEQVLTLSSVLGNIRLELPRDLEYAVRANFVAGGIRIRGERRGGLFQSVAVRSDGFAAAEKKLMIQVSSTFGEIKIV